MFFSKALNPTIEPPSAGRPADDPRYLPPVRRIGRPLVVFMGGAGDSAIKIMFKVAKEYGETHHACRDVYYRTHDAGAHVVRLVEAYHAAGQKTAVIGHSWGGASAVYAVAMKTGAPIDLLATLDPVGRFQSRPLTRPPGAARFINVYINYQKAELFNIPNLVARVGGAWQSVPCADEDHDFNTEKGASCERNPDHARAREMFSDFVKTHVEALR